MKTLRKQIEETILDSFELMPSDDGYSSLTITVSKKTSNKLHSLFKNWALEMVGEDKRVKPIKEPKKKSIGKAFCQAISDFQKIGYCQAKQEIKERIRKA